MNIKQRNLKDLWLSRSDAQVPGMHVNVADVFVHSHLRNQLIPSKRISILIGELAVIVEFFGTFLVFFFFYLPTPWSQICLLIT